MNLERLVSPDYIDPILSKCLLTTSEDVQRILQKPKKDVADLPTLLSPAATKYIEQMAQLSQSITLQRFGKTMQLFAPMYISNECYNTCTYCGFSMERKTLRKTLTKEEIHTECKFLKKKGVDHILVLTGESPKKVDALFIKEAIEIISQYFSSISIEVQPLETEEYKMLLEKGVDGLTLYQETYHPEAYAKYHLFGIKKNYSNRLDASVRGGKAGFFKMGLGALLGLHDWRYEALAMGQHLHFMRKNFWRTKYTVSFNRINEMGSTFKQQYPVSDITLVQLIVAFRIIFPDIGISLSTREPQHLRNKLIHMGITIMSAESSTAPGGYSVGDAEKQFETSDKRSFKEIKDLLLNQNYDPVMKDWDTTLSL
jgi:2-iminoacetate synthase